MNVTNWSENLVSPCFSFSIALYSGCCLVCRVCCQKLAAADFEVLNIIGLIVVDN